MWEEPDLYEEEQYEELSCLSRDTRTIVEKMRDITWLLEDDERLTELNPAEELMIAESDDVSPTNLDCLAEHTEHETVRTVIAQNINTVGATLHYLAQVSVSEETLMAIVENDASNAETLILIVLDESVSLSVKERIVEHYRFDEVVDELLYAYGVEYSFFPASWKHALSERKAAR